MYDGKIRLIRFANVSDMVFLQMTLHRLIDLKSLGLVGEGTLGVRMRYEKLISCSKL